MDLADLPPVDEHETRAAAGPAAVWAALLRTLDAASARPGVAAYARAVGCEPSTASGPRPLTTGSTVPGFRVVRAVDGRELVLAGSHRFARYSLALRLDADAPAHCRLRAETRATFPGRAGALYRLLVLGSGGHAVAVRRLLATVRRRAEHSRPDPFPPPCPGGWSAAP